VPLVVMNAGGNGAGPDLFGSARGSDAPEQQGERRNSGAPNG